ncbi:MAG: ChaN family lipoprotein [Pyrinomonadaceae bacterium]
MKLIKAIFVLLVAINVVMANENQFSVFDGKGNPADLDQIAAAMAESDVVFLGENHDDSVGHLVQLMIFQKIVAKYASERNVALSLEMFERDVQTVLNEYLNDQVSEKHFLAAARPWGNYATDYRPLVELAKSKSLPVIAANAPRRYVNMVSRLGRDSLFKLSPEAKQWLAPLPYSEPSAAYASKFAALMGMTGEGSGSHNPIIYSQALWDATMAHSISGYLWNNDKALVVHLNGGFHTEKRLGTPEHLSYYKKDAKFLVVTIRYEEDFATFDQAKHAGIGDFVVLTDASQPRSKQ